MTHDPARDIIDGRSPGGTNTSHTIAVMHLTSLLAALPANCDPGEYERAAVDHNLLGRSTVEGRRRTLRYLRELYLLDPRRLLFRALRDLWDEDASGRPLLAGLCAYARDSVFRASASGLLALPVGSAVTPAMLAGYVESFFPGAYSSATAAKIGRNVVSSWSQTGHLVGRNRKTRRGVETGSVATTFALLLGHLQGVRGQALYETRWSRFLDATPASIESTAQTASRRGYLELRSAGGVVEITFTHLLRPMEGVGA